MCMEHARDGKQSNMSETIPVCNGESQPPCKKVRRSSKEEAEIDEPSDGPGRERDGQTSDGGSVSSTSDKFSSLSTTSTSSARLPPQPTDQPYHHPAVRERKQLGRSSSESNQSNPNSGQGQSESRKEGGNAEGSSAGRFKPGRSSRGESGNWTEGERVTDPPSAPSPKRPKLLDNNTHDSRDDSLERVEGGAQPSQSRGMAGALTTALVRRSSSESWRGNVRAGQRAAMGRSGLHSLSADSGAATVASRASPADRTVLTWSGPVDELTEPVLSARPPDQRAPPAGFPTRASIPPLVPQLSLRTSPRSRASSEALPPRGVASGHTGGQGSVATSREVSQPLVARAVQPRAAPAARSPSPSRGFTPFAHFGQPRIVSSASSEQPRTSANTSSVAAPVLAAGPIEPVQVRTYVTASRPGTAPGSSTMFAPSVSSSPLKAPIAHPQPLPHHPHPSVCRIPNCFECRLYSRRLQKQSSSAHYSSQQPPAQQPDYEYQYPEASVSPPAPSPREQYHQPASHQTLYPQDYQYIYPDQESGGHQAQVPYQYAPSASRLPVQQVQYAPRESLSSSSSSSPYSRLSLPLQQPLEVAPASKAEQYSFSSQTQLPPHPSSQVSPHSQQQPPPVQGRTMPPLPQSSQPTHLLKFVRPQPIRPGRSSHGLHAPIASPPPAVQPVSSVSSQQQQQQPPQQQQVNELDVQPEPNAVELQRRQFAFSPSCRPPSQTQSTAPATEGPLRGLAESIVQDLADGSRAASSLASAVKQATMHLSSGLGSQSRWRPSRERAFKCDRCSKGFTEKGSLTRHIRTQHEGERNWRCEQCFKTFTEKGNLKRHIRTHTGERPFGCPHCSHRFKDTSQLKRHTLVHTRHRLEADAEAAKIVEALIVVAKAMPKSFETIMQQGTTASSQGQAVPTIPLLDEKAAPLTPSERSSEQETEDPLPPERQTDGRSVTPTGIAVSAGEDDASDPAVGGGTTTSGT